MPLRFLFFIILAVVMAIKKVTIEQFLELSQRHVVLDVRSPGEYAHAHIPGAHSLPLFTDEERKVVGTAYKQQGREKAIKIGLDFFGVKMRKMVEAVESITRNSSPSSKIVLVHCWRGGMRSAGVAWLLDLYGYNVYTLTGGYKAFRNWALNQFDKEYDFRILGGYTGSGKTDVLKQLQNKGQRIIDLEGIANHKGSAFGGIGQPAQPRQEMFENIFAIRLFACSSNDDDRSFWLEDESQRIGILNIPHDFWKSMRTKPVYFIDIPFEERLHYIISTYGSCEKEKLADAILRIQKRLGPLETKTAIGFLEENNYRECFRILLKYYDKLYNKALHNREDIKALLNKIECSSVDPMSITEKLLSCATVNA